MQPIKPQHGIYIPPNKARLLTYQSLDHEHALGPHVAQELVHVDRVLSLHPLQHAVQQDEGACPAHPGTAVDQHGGTILVVFLPHTANEADEGGGKLGNAVIWPAQEVVVHYAQRGDIRLGILG